LLFNKLHIIYITEQEMEPKKLYQGAPLHPNAWVRKQAGVVFGAEVLDGIRKGNILLQALPVIPKHLDKKKNT